MPPDVIFVGLVAANRARHGVVRISDGMTERRVFAPSLSWILSFDEGLERGKW
jgi:hypothetical protein